MKNIIAENQKKVLNLEIIITVDVNWSHKRWSVNECCCIVFDAKTGKFLDLEIIIRNSRDKHGNYEGAFSFMEGVGNAYIFNFITKTQKIIFYFYLTFIIFFILLQLNNILFLFYFMYLL
jgi:hypothetical protein